MKNVLNFTVILTILFLVLNTYIQSVYSEEVITIIPCSSNRNNQKFFDVPYYFISKGERIRWYNADDINHELSITNSSGGKNIIGTVKANASFSLRFNSIGIYHFVSPIFPWIHGNVTVTNDVSSVTIANPKNNVNVQLSWTPSVPKVGELVHFKIIFINKKTGQNQQHVDYIFSLVNPQNQTIYQQVLHSSWGVESASYSFHGAGFVIPKVTIDALLFQPIEPIEDNFKMSVEK
jgi:plastocyanin